MRANVSSAAVGANIRDAALDDPFPDEQVPSAGFGANVRDAALDDPFPDEEEPTAGFGAKIRDAALDDPFPDEEIQAAMKGANPNRPDAESSLIMDTSSVEGDKPSIAVQDLNSLPSIHGNKLISIAVEDENPMDDVFEEDMKEGGEDDEFGDSDNEKTNELLPPIPGAGKNTVTKNQTQQNLNQTNQSLTASQELPSLGQSNQDVKGMPKAIKPANRSIFNFGRSQNKKPEASVSSKNVSAPKMVDLWFNLGMLIADLVPDDQDFSEQYPQMIDAAFEQFKRCIVLTGKKFTQTFRAKSRQEGELVTRNITKQAFNDFYAPNQVDEVTLDAFFAAFEEDNGKLDYNRLYQTFRNYANSQESKDLEIEDIKMSWNNAKKTSVVSFFNLPPGEINRLLMNPKISVVINFEEFAIKVRSLLNHIPRDMDWKKVVAKMAEKCKVENQCDLVKFQAMMGFPVEEQQQFFNKNLYRDIVKNFQLKNIGRVPQLNKLREDFGVKRKDFLVTEAVFRTVMIDMMRVVPKTQFCVDINSSLRSLFQAFPVINTGNLQQATSTMKAAEFILKLDFEYSKMQFLQNLYLKMRQVLKRDSIGDAETFFRSIFDLPEGAILAETQISTEQCVQMLQEFEMVPMKKELVPVSDAFRYFEDEYNLKANEGNSVSCDQFVNDFYVVTKMVDDIFGHYSQYVLTRAATSKGSKNQGAFFKKDLQNADIIGVEDEVPAWLHHRDFLEWYTYRLGGGQFDLDVQNLFILNFSGNNDRKSFIDVPNFLSSWGQGTTGDRATQEFILRENEKQLLTQIALAALQRSQKVDFWMADFQGDTQSPEILAFQIWDRCLSQLEETSNLDVDKIQGVIQNFYTRHDNYGSTVNLNQFLQACENKKQQYSKSEAEFLRLKKEIDKAGMTIEMLLMQVKRTNDLKKQTMTTDDFWMICAQMNYKLKIDDISEIFSIFAKDSYGEIRCEDFIRAFKGVHKKMSALAAAGASIIEAKRYKPSFEEVVKDIVEQIEKRQLTNFGPLLKGFDFGNKSLISRNNFFSVLEKLFKAKPGDIGGLGEGDILSVLQHFDPHNVGQVNIENVAHFFDQYIQDHFCKVKLESQVAAFIEERIVDPADSTYSKRAMKPEDGVMKPVRYKDFMLTDILCGLSLKRQHPMDYLKQFALYREGELTKNEFVRALSELGVLDSDVEKEKVYEYMLQRVAVKGGKTLEVSFGAGDFLGLDLRLEDCTKILEKDCPLKNIDDLKEIVLTNILESLTISRIPAREASDHLKEPDRPWLMNRSQFTYSYLPSALKLEGTLTSNMMKLLADQFQNSEEPDFVNYEDLLYELTCLEQQNNSVFKIFMVTQDIFDFEATERATHHEKKQEKPSYVQPKDEPYYFNRSDKNTHYYEAVNTQPLGIGADDSIFDSIALATRRMGICVEKYFQKFGKFSTHDGIRYLNWMNFRDALNHLDELQLIAPLEDHSSSEQLFKFMCESSTGNSFLLNTGTLETSNRSTHQVTLSQIGRFFFQTCRISLQKLESSYLEDVYKAITDAYMIDKMQDILNFHNFDRNGTCPIQDFKKLLLEHMNLKSEFVSEEKVDILMQKYAILPSRVFQGQATIYTKQALNSARSGTTQDRRKPATDVKPTKVFFFTFFKDLAYLHRSLGYFDQWLAVLAEDMIKGFQRTCVLEQGRRPIQEDELAKELLKFFKTRVCKFDPNFVSRDDFLEALKIFSMTPEQGYNSNSISEDGGMTILQQIDTFFQICGLEMLSNPRAWKSNYLTPQFLQTKLQVHHNRVRIDQFIYAITFFGSKPVDCLFQDVLDQVYIVSKELQVSITGPRIYHLFSKVDPDRNGEIEYNTFIEELERLFNEAKSQQIEKLDTQITRRDLEFLACKYVLPGVSGKAAWVNYSPFIDDYDKIEHYGLGGDVSYVSNFTSKKRSQVLIVSKPWYERSTADLPKSSKDFYAKMGIYMMNKALDLKLCQKLAEYDELRKGHLSRKSIQDSIKCVLGKFGDSQMTQIVEVLSLNDDQLYNYLEMILYLFGDQMMRRVKEDFRLEFDGDRDVIVQDLSTITLTKNMIDQVELNLSAINFWVRKLNEKEMREKELFELMKKASVVPTALDVETILTYIKIVRDQVKYTFHFGQLLRHFQITENSSKLLIYLNDGFNKSGVMLEDALSKQKLNYVELEQALARCGIALTGKQPGDFWKLFYQISEGEDQVTKATFIRYLKLAETLVDTKPQLKPAPYCLNEFIAFLIKNKINLLERFADYRVSKKIPMVDFQAFLTQVKYTPLNPKDKMALIDFLIVPNDAQSSINFAKLVTYIRLLDPDYGKAPPKTQMQIERQSAKDQIAGFPHAIKAIIARLSRHLREKQWSKEQLFEALDTNKNLYIDCAELEAYFAANGLCQGLQLTDIQKLFVFLDCNQDGAISINEFCLLIEGAELGLQERMRTAFSKEFEDSLRKDITAMFERLDSDHNKQLSANELVQIFKMQEPDNGISLQKAREAVSKMDLDENGVISIYEFTTFILERQKMQLLEMEDQMEDLHRMFRDKVSKVGNDDDFYGGKNQFLTKPLLKELIQEAGYQAISDPEVESLFKEMDANQNGMVDIDEFMAFLYVADKVKVRDQSSRDTVFHIRKSRAKLNALDIFDMFNELPNSFTPSFSQKELESKGKNLPSSHLQVQYDYKTMKFSDIEKISDLQLVLKEFVAKHAPKDCFEVVIGEVVNVPLLSVLVDRHPCCELRVVLFDTQLQTFISSFYIQGASVVAKGGKTSQQISANWLLNEHMKSFVFKSDYNRTHLSLLFEFVVYGESQNPDKPNEKGNQVTVAWTTIALTAITGGKHKLFLQGGSPYNTQEIVTSENKHPTGTKAFLNKVSGKLQKNGIPPGPDRFITIETKPFSKMLEQTQVEISCLPGISIMPRSLVSFGAAFRIHCYQNLIKNQQERVQPRPDVVLAQFNKVYDNPEFVEAFAECWPLTTKQTLSTHYDIRVKKMGEFVTRSYALLYEPEMRSDKVYPARSTNRDSKLFWFRFNAIRMALMSNDAAYQKTLQATAAKDPRKNKDHNAASPPAAGPGQIIFLEDYKPFTVAELGANGFHNEEIRGLDATKEKMQDEIESIYAQMYRN